jgi:hypothetical protein
VARDCLEFEASRIDTSHARRIRRILQRLNWRQREGKRTADRFYFRPEDVEKAKKDVEDEPFKI